jgi:hypothetical protein
MKTTKLGIKVALFALVALGAGLVGPGVGVVQAQPERAPAVDAASAARAPRPGAQELLVKATPIMPAPRLERRLRRLRRADLSTAMMLASAEVVKQHYGRPFGSEIALEIEGRAYVARIERHFHPEGGSVKPWGYHPGVSLFAVEWRVPK